jgi:preprotein translocase subunit YajC
MESLLPLLLLAAMMWLLLIRPQQQRVKRQQALLGSLQVGDEIVTAGGLMGRIVSLDDEKMSVEIAPGTVVVFVRAAVSHRVTEPAEDAPVDDEPGSGPVDPA